MLLKDITGLVNPQPTEDPTPYNSDRNLVSEYPHAYRTALSHLQGLPPLQFLAYQIFN